MKINWKLVIGIVAGLAVLALIGYGFFMLGQNRMASVYANMSERMSEGGPPIFDKRGPVSDDNRDFNKPSFKGNGPDKFKGNQYGRGMDGFSPLNFGLMALGGFLRLVIPMSIFGGAIYLAYKQGQKSVQKVIEIEKDEAITKKTSK